ncbi:MAG: rhamnulokinase [Alicyclobacillus mali]|uniref:rhamnulokinase n=1 Tax=Alicyclobacillus mali (ex Roth et al. 2021) TaxID=1123961 RepID=UPI0023F54041|nr:rhamnulokinase family protein [Alicyclobacillus mali (ex Roth et al. 2021)]MCL6489458.1 rhamnulokinase [Alicyclobacillus mali (ex Roth et al. 2021)]
MLHVAAVDLGASSGRVMHGLFDGSRLELEERHRFSTRPVKRDGHLVVDVDTLYRAIETGLRYIAGVHPLASVGIDSWAVDFGLIDEVGRLVQPPRHYRDGAHEVGVRRAMQRISLEDLFRETGIQFLPFNSIYQLIALQQENEPLVLRSRLLLLLPDLLNFMLTGVAHAEWTNATTTQLVSVRTKGWATEVLERLGLPASLFPEIRSPGTLLGPARHLVEVGPPQVVHVASHDTASAVVAVPAMGQPYLYISSGTWSLVGTVVPEPITSDDALRWNFSNEGGVGNYRLLKNVMGLWLLQELEREWATSGEPVSLPQMLQEAQRAQPFAHLFDPDHPRFLRPPSMTEAIQQAVKEWGGHPPEERGEMVRAVLESLALKYRVVVEEVKALTGFHYDAVHVVGGGSQNALLSQWTADCLGLPVLAGPSEASAWGNALMQLVGLGEISNLEEARALLRSSVALRTYEPANTASWEDAYARFRERLIHRPTLANS